MADQAFFVISQVGDQASMTGSGNGALVEASGVILHDDNTTSPGSASYNFHSGDREQDIMRGLADNFLAGNPGASVTFFNHPETF